MSLTINDTTMTSDQSPHTARQAPGHRHGWEVSWLPGQVLDRDTAITAMILADIAATGDIRPDHRLWPAVQSWSAEVGLTGPDAIDPRLPAAPRRPPARASRTLRPGGWSRTRTGRPPTDHARTPTPGRGTRPRPGCAPTRPPRPTSPAAHPTCPARCPRTGCSRTWPCTSTSSATACSPPTPAAPPSTTSPPAGWPSGSPPAPSRRPSPAP